MAILPIVIAPAEVLRRKAKPVERVTKRVQKLIRDMADTMYDAPGVGLAAPQVGVSERIIVADAGDGLVCLVNPRIISREGSEVDIEGCLSIPNVAGYVERAAALEVEGLNERGRAVRFRAEGHLARVLQHEIDHLDGILFTDIATGIRRTDGADGDDGGEGDEGDEGGEVVNGGPGLDGEERGAGASANGEGNAGVGGGSR